MSRNPSDPPCYDIPHPFELTFVGPLLIAVAVLGLTWVFNIPFLALERMWGFILIGMSLGAAISKLRAYYGITLAVLIIGAFVLTDFKTLSSADFWLLMDGIKVVFNQLVALVPALLLGGAGGRLIREIYLKYNPSKYCVLPKPGEQR